MIFPLLLALILSVGALVFALQNAQPTSISILFWHIDSSLALVVIVVFVVGLLTGILMVLPGRIRSALATSGSRRERTELERKLAESKAKLEQSEALLKEKTGAASSNQAGSPKKQ